MLNNQSVGYAMELASQLTRQKVELVPLPETPLFKMVTACQQLTQRKINLPNQTGITSNQTITDISLAVCQSADATILPNCDVSKHDIFCDHVIEEEVKCIESISFLARNVVNPIITGICENVEADLDVNGIQASSLQIVAVEWPSLWDHPQFIDRLAGSRNGKVMGYPVAQLPPHAARNQEQVFDLLKMGSKSLDEQIEKWALTLGLETIQQIYHTFFVVGLPADQKERFFKDPLYGKNNQLGVYLIAKHFMLDAPEEIEVSLADYRDALSQIIVYVAHLISYTMETRERFRTRLVISYPQRNMETALAAPDENVTIYVNGDIYREWLKNGGKPEIIMGAYLGDQPCMAADLDASAADCFTAWNSRVAAMKAHALSRRMSNVRSIVKRAAIKQVRELDDNYIIETTREKMIAEIEQHVARIGVNNLQHLGKMVRNLVCSAMFPNTSVKLLLDTMDRIMATDPDLAPRDASAIATLEMICDHVCQMMVHQSALVSKTS